MLTIRQTNTAHGFDSPRTAMWSDLDDGKWTEHYRIVPGNETVRLGLRKKRSLRLECRKKIYDSLMCEFHWSGWMLVRLVPYMSWPEAWQVAEQSRGHCLSARLCPVAF